MNSVYDLAKAERKARSALEAVAAARLAAQKAEANRKWRDRPDNQWFERQKALAKGDDVVESELIVIRTAHGADTSAVILWDIICLDASEATRLREPSRSRADAYARGLRAAGRDVRVRQSGY